VADACGVSTPAGSGPDGHEVIPIGTEMVAGFRAARASRSEPAAVVVARRGKNASARAFSVRRRAISDARSFVSTPTPLSANCCIGTIEPSSAGDQRGNHGAAREQ
jgi:hypothetical protein